MQTTNKTLSAPQIAALAYVATHKGFISDTKSGTARNTLKSLEKLGLLSFYMATEWRHGLGNTVQYKITEQGRELVRIGRMLRAFTK